MNRLTKDDVKEMGLVDLAHNQVFIKDGEAWYRDFEREISVRDLAKEMFDFHNIKYSSNLDEFDEDMMYLLEDDYQTIEGVIALFYRSLWAFADIRETLKAYEDTGRAPEEINKNFDGFVKEVYENAVNHGWWQEKKSFGDIIALCHTELSEAFEEYRNGHTPTEIYTKCKMDDLKAVGSAGCGVCKNCPVNKPEGIPIELADCIIRIFDYCGKENIDIENAIRIKHEYNKGRTYKHGGKIL